jgi:nitrogen-specific signal transduction histidine kinase
MVDQSQSTGKLPPNNGHKYPFLDIIPIAAAVWDLDGAFVRANEPACRLFGVAALEIQSAPSRWLNHIHRADADAYRMACDKLAAGDNAVSWEYSVVPKKAETKIWILETSRSLPSVDDAPRRIISTYSNVSDSIDRRVDCDAADQLGRLKDLIGAAIHEVRNNLQVIRGVFDLLTLEGGNSKGHQKITDRVDQTNRLLSDLSFYVKGPSGEADDIDTSFILDDLERRMNHELAKHAIRLRVVRRGPLVPARIGLAEFRTVIEKVLEFSCSTIPNGGELKIDSCLRKIEGERYLELAVSTAGEETIPVAASDVFRPFLAVGNQSLGISMTLAQEILRRHSGKIIFEKSNPTATKFRILLKPGKTL